MSLISKSSNIFGAIAAFMSGVLWWASAYDAKLSAATKVVNFAAKTNFLSINLNYEAGMLTAISGLFIALAALCSA